MNTLDTGMTLNRAHAPAQLLLVDDDPLLRRMAARTLGHAGFEVVEAGDGEEALLRFAEHPADLVLLDLEMPGLGGHVVCERIRAMPLGARVPILILTGRNDTESIELAYQHGATDFITKPINWLLLSHRVRYALRASRAAEAVLRNQESTARAQRLAHLGSWFAHTDGRVDSSTELMRLYGAVPGTRWGARDFIARVVHADRRRVLQARRALAHDGTAYQAEFGVQRLDGCLRRMFEQATPVVDELGRVQGFEGITQDITDRVQAAERIRQLALFDEVTGLPNRRHFIELSAPLLDRARRNGHVCAVMHVNIDRFVGINDALGRVQGDAVLRLIAQRLRGWIRGSDLTGVGAAEQGVLARFGGSTFTLLIDDLTGQEQAASVAQRLVDAIAEPIGIEARSLVLAASIGIALFPCDAQDAAGLVGCAEQALHAARDAGGGGLRRGGGPPAPII
jgi:diguanylate cyclase (GGDEF)-like protein